MVDQTTIFKAEDKPLVAPESNSQAPVVDPNSPLAILVGEGRKYKTPEELAKAYIHIDEFVETLKGDNTKLRQELEKAKTLDEVLERLQTSPRSAQDTGVKKGADVSASLSVADVVKIVGEQLTGRETARTRESNLLKADAEMKRLFGEKSKEMFDKEASTPALRNALIELASVSPDKFVALFAPPSQGGQTVVDNKTNVNTGALTGVALSGRAADPGCKEFYDAMRRKDPARYYSQATQLQIQQAGTANPDKYFGRK